ncbi:MarR family winged helix-turn-helix transcriptional regulator [Pseudaminobacter sp. NGMCC 1.201702]|uniref:MarR family winged helix-turn-helix transcriptional regulator n=1 Tax=Pseudaminobacter sp. NGMCC 1.201702 TaxID=3391825 RepID=UPI0039EF9113
MVAIFDAISEPIARRITGGLVRIGLVLKSRAWKGAGSAGVTPTQGQALSMLREAPAGLHLSALAKLLGVSAPTASDMVNSLVAKGLARKEAGTDKRSITLKLTTDGEALAARTMEWPDFLGSAVEALAPAEQAAFLRMLVKLIRTLQINGDIPLQRMCITCRHFRPNAHDGPNPHHCAFVDAPFGDRHLRLNCAEQEEADDETKDANWQRFVARDAIIAAS